MEKVKTWFATSSFSKMALGGFLSLSFGLVAHAATTGVQELPGQSITNVSGLTAIICSFLAYFFWIVLVVSVIMVLYAAFVYVTAADDTEKTSKARRTLTYAAVGIAVALISTALPSIVGSIFPSNPNASLNDVCNGIGV
jgi:heme/copper-type cytochrome/quinol oxidase subunit 2